MINLATPKEKKDFKAYFQIGMQEYYISVCTTGYATFSDRYSCPATNQNS